MTRTDLRQHAGEDPQAKVLLVLEAIRPTLKVIIIVIFLSVFMAGEVFSAYYFVRKGATGSNNGSNWTNAWSDINNISGLAVGDTVYIAGGNYTGTYIFTASGTAGNRITIKKATVAEHGSATGWNTSYDGTVTFTGGGTVFTVSQRSFITIDGVDRTEFILNGNSSANYGIYGEGTSTHSVIIKNLSAHHFLNAAISFGLSSGFGNNIEIDNCEIYKNGNGSSHETDGGIILLYASNIGQGRNKIHHNYLHDGCISANMAKCDLITGDINHTDFYNNHFDGGWTTASSADYLHINGNYNNIYNNLFEGGSSNSNQNLFFHTNNPCGKNPTSNYVYNNIFYKTSSAAGYGIFVRAHTGGCSITDTHIYNNVFYGHFNEIYLRETSSNQITGFNIRNNIFVQTNDKSIYSYGNELSDATVNYNRYHPSSCATTDIGTIGGANRTFTEWQSYGFDANGSCGDPQFDSIGPGGFYLTESSPSPVVDGGADLSGIFTTDKAGVKRPLGSSWDMGAYEYNSGGNNPGGNNPLIPNPPEGLQLQ